MEQIQALHKPAFAPPSFDVAAEPEYFHLLLDEVRSFWSPLPDKPEETPEGIVRSLWLTAAGTPVSVVRASRLKLPILSEAAYERCRRLIDQKRAGVPLAHLTERQSFLGLEMLAGPEALVPRVETEILGRAALAKLAALAQERGTLQVIDLCTGSGNLALAYAHYEPRARVHAADLSAEAVAFARRNAAHVGLKIDLRVGDLFAPFDAEEFLGQCDFVSCNPPYIPAAKVPQMHDEISAHEPELAFNGGIYGISVLTKLLREAPRYLKPGSWLGFELGAGQGPALVKRLESNPAFSVVEPQADDHGEIRAILARTPG
jgi:release factor glutamine methyltransferase